MALKTDYKDDVLDGLRKYRMVNNSDGTVSFVDVTIYDQEGDDYGANDINATNEAVNNVVANLATIENTTTASKAYAVGDFLVYDGVLYKVTQAISSGGTISIGTNVVADKVGDEIAQINSDLTDIESHLTDLLIVNIQNVSVKFNNSWYSYTDYTPNAFNGYHPVGIIGFQMDNGSAVPIAINTTRVYLADINRTNRSDTVTAYLRILYAKDNL